jgi:tRNA nucleotidyltransferase (CCA-adding enzyme)
VNTIDLRQRFATHVPAPPRARLEAVRGLAEARALPLYLVGGFVRDVLLGIAPDDFDLVVEGDAPALALAARDFWGGSVTVHAPFGTAAWTAPDGVSLDFASARTETYSQPATLPRVRYPVPITDDLRRRDFTINALALRLDGAHFGELLDPFQGRDDLAARAIRVLHSASFQDDPTRLFRAVRYEQRLRFHITPETLTLLPGAWSALTALTADRVRREFELIFREANAPAMLARLAEFGILAHVHPGLRWTQIESERAARLSQLPWRDWELSAPPEPDAFYWALLLAGAADAPAAATRLNLNREVSRAVSEALRLRKSWARPSEAVAVLDGLSELGVMAAYLLHEALRNDLHAYLTRWRRMRAQTTGDDLIARGLRPGPGFKNLLWQLRAARLDGEIADAADERRWLEAHLNQT